MGEATPIARQRTEHAREELASDLHALTEKLNVKKQVDRKRSEVVDNVKEKLGMQASYGQSNSEVGAVASSMKSHPLAVLALGYGATTLFKAWQSRHAQHQHGATGAMSLPPYTVDTDSSTGSRVDGAKEKVAGAADTAKTAVTDAAGTAKSAVSSKVDSVKETADDLALTARMKANDVTDAVGTQVSSVQARAGEVGSAIAERAHGASDAVTRVAPTSMPELERMVRQNLPAFGIGAFAVGAVAGLLAPRTKLEDERIGERLGEVREQLVETVQEKAIEAKDAVQHGLQEGVSTVKDTAKEDLGMTESSGDTAPLKGTDVSSGSDDLLIKPLAGMSAGAGDSSSSPDRRPGRIIGSRGTGGPTDSLDVPRSTSVGSDIGSP